MSEDTVAALGINVGLVVAGFFGGLLTVGKAATLRVRATLTALVAGVASANYLTPLALDLLGVTNPNLGYSVGFVFGFLGLRGVELVAARLTKPLREEQA